MLLVLPLALPGIITGIALNSALQWVGLNLSLPTIVIGHATFCIVVVYNNVIARLCRVSDSPYEAAADLGAQGWFAFRTITLPLWISGAIRLGQQLPELNVVVMGVLLLTVIPVALAARLTGAGGMARGGSAAAAIAAA